MASPDLSDVRSASELTRQALGLEQLGDPAPEATWCSLCGRPVAEGEPVRQGWKPGSNFMDHFSLVGRHDRGGLDACGDCLALLPKSVFQRLQAHVISADGAYPIRQDIHRAWFLENPPEPPFVAVHQTAHLQHLVWKAPVNWSRNRFFVLHGDQLLTIDRNRLTQALESLQAVPEAVRRAFAFGGLDRNLEHLNLGQLHTDLMEQAPEVAHQLRNLRHGDLWALATLSKAKVEPTQPGPVTLT